KALPVLEKLPMETSDREKGLTLSGKTINKCPADIPEELAKALQKSAEDTAFALGVNAYAKFDFIASQDGKSFVCLECDSLPQLYPDSDLVISAKAAGRSFGDLCDKIMEISLVSKSN
ncbi:MAG: D-alanine--D-alanine ligase, partial [Lachnospiraceae bacterium]|nr:D-alanine--D-alanine ligase [Lachnospiraceae bacterium]